MQLRPKMKTPRRAALSENQLMRVETTLSLRAAVAGIGHMAVFVAFRQLTPFANGVPAGVNLAGILIFLILLARWALVLLQRAYFPDPLWRARWRFLFRTVSLILALSWSLATISTLYACGLTFSLLPPIVIILGVASIAVQAFGLDLLFTQIFLAMILGPPILAIFFYPQPGHIGLALILTCAMGYLVFLANNAFRLLLEALENRELIQFQRDQLTAVLDAIPGYVFWTNSRGQPIGMNRHLSEVCDESDDLFRNPLISELEGFLKSDKPELLIETSLRLPKGARNALVAVKKYQGSNELQAVVIAIDTEDRKRAQRELEKTRAQAQESARLAALGVMAGGIAHEINNPLQVIRALAELLKRDDVDVLQASAKIEATTDRVAKIIAGLRSFARDGHDYPLEEIEVEPLISDVMDLARLSQPRHRVRIEVEPIPEALLIECRRTEIGQVLINLMNNAFDAIRDLPDPWIRIRVKELPEEVKISVEDCGPGISPEIAEKIMVPFFTTKEIGKGTGLGLSISRSIAEGHHGSLVLERSSHPTTFVLTIPKHQPRKQTEPRVPGAPKPHA